jgi:hypothetical protein
MSQANAVNPLAGHPAPNAARRSARFAVTDRIVAAARRLHFEGSKVTDAGVLQLQQMTALNRLEPSETGVSRTVVSMKRA